MNPAPHDLTTEAALLGAMMLDPRIIPDVESVIAGPETFYDERHSTAYAAMTRIYGREQSLDFVQLQAELPKDLSVESIIEYAQTTPATTGWPQYAAIITRHHTRRRLIAAAETIAHDTRESAPDCDASELLDRAESAITTVVVETQANRAGVAVSLEAAMQAELERLDAIHMGREQPQTIKTGLIDIDNTLGGLLPSQLVIVGARPSIGKTAFGLNLSTNIALAGTPVAVFSLEMDTRSITQRMLCTQSGVPMSRLTRNLLDESAFHALGEACGVLADAKIFIDDSSQSSVMRVRSEARRMVRRHGVGLVVIDYLQLLTCPGKDRENRQVEVSAISRGLKALAKELRIPVLCLAQINRQSEQRSNFRPRMSDLRESGSIEQDADVVLLLHREEAHHIGDDQWLNDPANEKHLGTAELIVAKQRNGPVGSVTLTWDAGAMAFRNHARQW